MGTKELVLRMLECQRDRHVSGAWLAEELGVTRNAVWKAVEALRAEGYVVEAATNRGYRLAQENDLLSPASIERFLPDGHPFDITVRKSVDSTNAEARRRALEGAPEGVVVVAEEQTAGRGRLGKTFYSPAGAGVYLSVVLRPRLQADAAQYLTCAAAVACAQAIEAVTGAEASRIFRTPGGNFGDDVVKNIGPLIKAEIGWNIDSSDWRRPGADAIAKQIEDAWPGAIVLMHDGGGNRSQTIEALKKALPRLKDQGYRFITIDELLQYPLS